MPVADPRAGPLGDRQLGTGSAASDPVPGESWAGKEEQTWRKPSSSRGPSSGTDKTLSFETGRLAFQSQGAVVAKIAGTEALVTANAAKGIRESAEQSPAQAWDDTHLDGDIQAALQALPPDYRAAVVLCDIEGFSYEEIAATMGVKLGTVRSRIHRGRAQLRAALAHRDRDRRVRER